MLEKNPSFSLPNFEGPLDLLLYLVQKEEIDILDVTIKELTEQLTCLMAEAEVDLGAHALVLTATLLLLKSQRLLPKTFSLEICDIEDPRLEIMQQLLEYSRFRDAAVLLTAREQSQKVFFPRQAPTFVKTQPSCIEELTLQDLVSLFKEVIQRTEKAPKKIIQEEVWQVAKKIAWLRETLHAKERLPFKSYFSEEKSREELVVSFLALLELMKINELRVVEEGEMIYITRYGL